MKAWSPFKERHKTDPAQLLSLRNVSGQTLNANNREKTTYEVWENIHAYIVF